MIVKQKMDGGIRQGLAWLHNLWQHTGCADQRLTAHTDDDYYHRVPIEIVPGMERDALILYLSPLELDRISVSCAGEVFSFIPAENQAIASSESADTLALAKTLPDRNPLNGWPEKPRLCSFLTEREVSLDKVLSYLASEPLFADAKVSVRYHKGLEMTDYLGNPGYVMTLISWDPAKKVMLGYNRMLHYLLIWGPEGMAIPEAASFLKSC